MVLVIEANVEMFNSLHTVGEDFTIYLVDCPGMEYLRKDTQAFFSIFSQMIYILNYARFLQNTMKNKRELFKKPLSG